MSRQHSHTRCTDKRVMGVLPYVLSSKVDVYVSSHNHAHSFSDLKREVEKFYMWKQDVALAAHLRSTAVPLADEHDILFSLRGRLRREPSPLLLLAPRPQPILERSGGEHLCFFIAIAENTKVQQHSSSQRKETKDQQGQVSWKERARAKIHEQFSYP